MELIDSDSYRRKLENAICRNLRVGRPNPVVLMVLKYAIATLDSEPVVDAVPVSFIQKRISYLQEIADYEFEASGGYTGEASTQLFELRRLILGWSMREKANESD